MKPLFPSMRRNAFLRSSIRAATQQHTSVFRPGRMVVLSVAICTKAGKPLLARQFVEMTRIRIEGLLAAFPKLISTDQKNQHTFVETDAVRYLYHPLDTVYLVLITNRASNIIEDLDTLRLVSKVVPNITGTTGNLSEEKVQEKCFDLIFAFDEMLTQGGYREPVTLQQIRTHMEMDSHEEKLHNMIKLSKMESAKEQAATAARALKEKRLEGKASSGFGGGSAFEERERDFASSSSASSAGVSFSAAAASSSLPAPPPQRSAPVKGMSLGGAAKSSAFEDALLKEEHLAPLSAKISTASVAPAQAASAPAAATAAVAQQPVMLEVKERVSAKVSRDGVLESLEIKGGLTLTAQTDDVSNCSIQLASLQGSRAAAEFSFSTHPKLNKALFDSQALLQLKDQSKGFPSARPVGLLKWTNTANNEDLLPLKINCWPEEEGRGMTSVSIEYSMDVAGLELHDVRIHIPLNTSAAPSISVCDGAHRYAANVQELVWEIAHIDRSNASGSLEFSIAQKDTGAFFPINVHFSAQSLLCPVRVVDVLSTGKAPIRHGIAAGMSSEEYVIA